MKRLLALSLVLSTLFTSDNSLYAQNYNWVKGGASGMDLTASLYDEQVTNMCTDANGNVYSLSVVGYGPIVADTFHRADSYGGHNNLFVTSYNCNGQMRLGKVYRFQQ